ncbi:type II secretion system F family protein [bacterium]|nr:type II secretion system F family protein [bacterium]
MNLSIILIALAVVALIAAGLMIANSRREKIRAQVYDLIIRDLEAKNEDDSPVDWTKTSQALNTLTDKLGQAGFITPEDRVRAKNLKYCFIFMPALSGFTLGALKGSVPLAFGLSLLGLYLGLVAWVFYLKNQVKDFRRELMYQIPLGLESIILLVEAGLGILPAMERVVTRSKSSYAGKHESFSRILALVYELTAHGMPFSMALEAVASATNIKLLRHVLLHLDISGSEGGELIPSLRSLSDHAHTEWRLSVERRVKKLENYVVFPVFASVIGLMILTAAVPIVPLLNLRQELSQKRSMDSSPLK